GTSYTINSRMIDIKTGEATLGENATGNDLNLLTSLSRSLLDDLLGPEWKQADPKSQRDKRDLADSANKGTREKATKGLSEGSGDESGAKDYMSLDKWEILDGSWYAEDGAIIGSGGHIIMNEEFRDSVFKVNVEHLSGPKSGVGIGTRSTVVPGGQKSFRNHTSINQGYAFNFSFEKNYNIYSGLSGNWYPMNPNWKKYEWQRSELFREDVNNVRVEAIGKHTKIYVNNRFLVEYEDSSHTVGAPLLWVQDPAEKVRFFNIRIHRK
ncbi:MAG: DUF1080 domain-containing protein, partial [Deltaproteobacteria bacterium]|nr:DUF1080 domain-containing protein [Deltaproteobacteria bacterium]